MAKVQNQPPVNFAGVENSQDNLTPQNVKEQAAKLIGDFSSIPDSMLQSLTQDYLQLKENTRYDMVFTGMSSFKGDRGSEVESVLLIDENNKQYINGNTVLVNSLKSKVTHMPCFVRITTGEKLQGKNGLYMDMDVLVLAKTIGKIGE